jgi:hypothetical protein
MMEKMNNFSSLHGPTSLSTLRIISTFLLYAKQNAPGIKIFVHP